MYAFQDQSYARSKYRYFSWKKGDLLIFAPSVHRCERTSLSGEGVRSKLLFFFDDIIYLSILDTDTEKKTK